MPNVLLTLDQIFIFVTMDPQQQLMTAKRDVEGVMTLIHGV